MFCRIFAVSPCSRGFSAGRFGSCSEAGCVGQRGGAARSCSLARFIASARRIAVAVERRAVRLPARRLPRTGGNRALERRMRIHANFAEYVPLALLLLAFMEMGGRPSWLVHAFCIALVLARIGHVVALWQEPENFRLRVLTVSTTFVVMIGAAVSLLARALQLW